jgi:hypothetical protein
MRRPQSPTTFTNLTDWSKSSDDALKYYSGKATYNTIIKINNKPSTEKLLLDLGTVKNMATVKINGQFVGAVWAPPYSVDITNAVKKGDNKIEIEVVNLWVNRLIGDAKLPAAERKTWMPINPIKPTDALESSGLLGPVVLQKVTY